MAAIREFDKINLALTLFAFAIAMLSISLSIFMVVGWVSMSWLKLIGVLSAITTIIYLYLGWRIIFSLNPKPKISSPLAIRLQTASTETLYDCIKWIAFGFLAVIWLGATVNLQPQNWWWLIIFITILFIINIRRERSLERDQSG